MPYKRKYTTEQKEQAYKLYWAGRGEPVKGEKHRGDYTLAEIEQITGVPAKTAYAYARGLI